MQNELYHHGIKGQKWGIRKYQNSDGSLTPEGKIRYGYGAKKDSPASISGHSKVAKDALKTERKLNKQINKAAKKNDTEGYKKAEKELKNFNINKQKAYETLNMSPKEASFRDASAKYYRRIKKAAIIGGIVGGPWGAAAGATFSHFTNTGRAYMEAYRNAEQDYKEEQNRRSVFVV